MERHASKLKEGQVFIFSKGLIKLANKKFTSIQNDYSITFGLDADIWEATDNGSIKKEVGYKFVTIKEIADSTDIWTIDCIGVVLTLESPITIRLWNGGEKRKKTVLFADDSEKPNGMSINLCFWGDLSDMELEIGDVLALKKVWISEFSGKSLNTVEETDVAWNPDSKRGE